MRQTVAATILGTLLANVPCAAQAAITRTTSYELGAGVSYFPSYVSRGPETQQWGVEVLGRLLGASPVGLEVGYSHVPQHTTASDAAPRLHAFRVMAVDARLLDPARTLLLSWGLGLSALSIKAQQIDCGNFPLCSEWSPNSGTRIGPVGVAGAQLQLGGRAYASIDFRATRPIGGEWSPARDPDWVTEVSAGLRLRLGGS